jgi:hypothetical protein
MVLGIRHRRIWNTPQSSVRARNLSGALSLLGPAQCIRGLAFCLSHANTTEVAAVRNEPAVVGWRCSKGVCEVGGKAHCTFESFLLSSVV